MKLGLTGIVKGVARRAGFEIRRITAASSVGQIDVALGGTEYPTDRSDRSAFIFDDGAELTISETYRRGVKTYWKAIPALRNLDVLRNAGRLSEAETKQFIEFCGARTITRRIEDVEAFALPLLIQSKDLFEEGSFTTGAEGFPLFDAGYYRRVVQSFETNAEQDLGFLRGQGYPPSRAILDVGCGRGVSTAAFANLGLRATGMDNNHGGGSDDTKNRMMKERLSDVGGENCEFHFGDITNCPELEGEQFDLIYSNSCLEHISDLQNAFREMYRLLEPGGVMLHHLNPFWCENGGHAFGTLDLPWLHAMTSEAEFNRYLDELRPFEAPIAKPWIKPALNRHITINAIQRFLLDTGFELSYWSENMGKPESTKYLGKSVLRRVQLNYPDVTLADLLATDITFHARKPEAV